MCRLSFREGLEVAYRPDTEDWEVVKEVMLYGVYALCLEHLARQKDSLPVLDLGANIGLFSLQAAQARAGIEVHAYEPAPPNLRMLAANLEANPSVQNRVKVHPEAVGGTARTASFFYDDKVPQGSSLFTDHPGRNITVSVRSFPELIETHPTPFGLVKMDIEGAEYEVLTQTPPDLWKRVRALSIELHEDPAGTLQRQEAVARLQSLGYRAIKEKAGANSYFFYRE